MCACVHLCARARVCVCARAHVCVRALRKRKGCRRARRGTVMGGEFHPHPPRHASAWYKGRTLRGQTQPPWRPTRRQVSTPTRWQPTSDTTASVVPGYSTITLLRPSTNATFGGAGRWQPWRHCRWEGLEGWLERGGLMWTGSMRRGRARKRGGQRRAGGAPGSRVGGRRCLPKRAPGAQSRAAQLRAAWVGEPEGVASARQARSSGCKGTGLTHINIGRPILVIVQQGWLAPPLAAQVPSGPPLLSSWTRCGGFARCLAPALQSKGLHLPLSSVGTRSGGLFCSHLLSPALDASEARVGVQRRDPNAFAGSGWPLAALRRRRYSQPVNDRY
jgi:hypothetical protein